MALRLVSLSVPTRVYRGDQVRLSCLYDLGNQTLYSLKWFFKSRYDREEKEFFRFTPSDSNPKQYFPIPGIKVDVR